MLELLLLVAVIFIVIYVLSNKSYINDDTNVKQDSKLVQLNGDKTGSQSQNINIGDVTNETNAIVGETNVHTTNNTIPQLNGGNSNVTQSFLDNLKQAEKNDDSENENIIDDDSNSGNDESPEIGIDTGIDYVVDNGEKTPAIIDINKLEQIEEDRDIINSALLNQLDISKNLGDLFIGDIAEKAAKLAINKSLKILSHMKKNIKNPKGLQKIINGIKLTSKNTTNIIKRQASKYAGNSKNGRFVGGLNKRMKYTMTGDLFKSTKRKLPFKGIGAASMSKIGLKTTMKMTGNAAKSMGRMGAKFAKSAIKSGASAFTLVSTIVDLIDPFGFENMQSNKQYYRMKRKMDMEWARTIYDEYNDIEREKTIKGIDKSVYIPLHTPMYWGPIHEIHAHEAPSILSPTIENTKDQVNRERIMTSYMNNLMKIIDREFDRYLEDDANWTEFENKLKNMKEHLVCAEVEEYEDVEREAQLHKYFSEWGFVSDDDMWNTYKNYIPKYECRAVPPDVTGARSASKYSEALIEQDLIPYEAAFLYLQIFINFMEKIAIPGAYRMVCEEFPTKWVKNTLSRADINKLHSRKIDDKWDMLNQLEQAMVLLGNMKNDKGGALYDQDHHYIKALLKMYKRQVMSMEIASSEDCTLNYFNDGSFNITNDDIKNITDAMKISTDHFNKSYEENDNVEQWLGEFNSMKINPSIIRNDKGGGINFLEMLAGSDKCEPREYCETTGSSRIPIIGNISDLVSGNNSCKLKQPSVTFNFEPEEYVFDSCNISCYTEWTDWEFIRLLNKYRPDIEEYMEKNGIVEKIDEYIDIVDDCFDIVSNNDICDPDSSGETKAQCDKIENSCSIKDGKFKLTETKKQQLRKLGIIRINDSTFDREFNRLYDILINGRINPNSTRFGVCPLNYCKKNMDRMERDDEMKRIQNSCMYRHKDSCVLNWSEASADMRVPYYYWDKEYNTCFVNKNIWQYRTLCDCATKKGNGLIGRIQHDEIEDPEAMLEGALIGRSLGLVMTGSPRGALKGAAAGAALRSGDNTALGSMVDTLKDGLLCNLSGTPDKSMQAYNCDDLTNLSGEDYNNMGTSIGMGKPGSALNTAGDVFKFGKTGYSKEDRAAIKKKLTANAKAEDDFLKKEKIYMQLELLNNPDADVNTHSKYTIMKGKFNELLGCKCGIQLQPNTGNWKTDVIRQKKNICEGSLGVNISGIPDRGVNWNDEDHDTYPNACVTNSDFCSDTGGCWFHNNNINPPHGYGDCEIPQMQAISESVLGTTYTRLSKKAFESIPGADNKVTCMKS